MASGASGEEAREPLLEAPPPSSAASCAASSKGSRGELAAILVVALPVSCAELLSFSTMAMQTAAVGQFLGAVPLSSFTLARTMYHLTGLALVCGLASAQPTFSGQAFGAGAFRLLGVQLQRASLLCFILASCSVAGWLLGAEQLMGLFGQDPSLISPAAACLRIMAPSLFLRVLIVCIKNYFFCQSMVLPIVIISAKVALITPSLNYLLIERLGYGLDGAAHAYNAIALCEAAMLACAVVGHSLWVKRRHGVAHCTWRGFSSTALQGVGPYMRLALPSAAMVLLSWWCFEAIVLIAGLQKDASTQLGGMGVMHSTHTVAFMLANGFGCAAATRVANELGAGNSGAAKRAMRKTSAIAFGLAAALAAALVALGEPWARLFSRDEEVVAVVVSSMPFLACSIVFDSLNIVLSGVLRGSGRQAVGFFVNLGTFWALGLPLAALLDLWLGMGAKGVWIALAGISTLQACVLAIATTLRFNWDSLVLIARTRAVVEQEGQLPLLGEGHHGIVEDKEGGRGPASVTSLLG